MDDQESQQSNQEGTATGVQNLPENSFGVAPQGIQTPPSYGGSFTDDRDTSATQQQPVSTPQPAAQTTPPDISSVITKPPKKEKSKLAVGLVIGILLIIILGAGGFYLYTKISEKRSEPEQSLTTPLEPVTLPTEPVPTSTPAQSPTENWKTYTGNGYVIKYPSIGMFESSATAGSEKLTYKLTDTSEEEIVVSISSEESDLENISVLDLGEEIILQLAKVGEYDDARKSIGDTNSDTLVTYYLLNDGMLYTLEISGSLDEDYLETILGTFRFLEAGEIVGCSLLDLESPGLAFLSSYCLGVMCEPATTQEECETVDVVTVATGSGKLLEESEADGIGDCVWSGESSGFESKCKIKYE